MKSFTFQKTFKKNLFSLIYTLCIFLSLAPPSLAQRSKANFTVSPYIQDISDETATIMWETSEPCLGLILSAKAEYEILVPQMEIAAKDNNPKILHRMQLQGLKSDEVYYYQVINIGKSGDTLKGPVTSLTIPNYYQSPVTFTALGDSQGNPKVWGRISELMLRETPQFIIHAGDLVQYGPHQDDWTEEFFRPASKLLSHVPLYPTIGNHEMNDPKFYQYYNLPNDNAFYSIKKGDVRIISIDTNKDMLPGSAQYRKLELLLANTKEKWKIIVHHHPIFNSDMASYRSSLMAKPIKGDPNILHLKTLYDNYGVDIVLAGHIHGYERTQPIYKNHIDNDLGTVHIITGGAGGRLRFQAPAKNWFSAKIRKTNHFLNFSIWKNTLTMEAIDTSGTVFDTWQKEKNPAMTPLIPPLVQTNERYFMNAATLNLTNPNGRGSMIVRTNDGEYQTASADKHEIKIDNTTTVTAFIIDNQAGKSREIVKTLVKLPIINSPKTVQKALTAEYFEDYLTLLPDFSQLTATKVFSPDSISLHQIQPRRENHFAVRFKGAIHIPETSVYRFLLESYDGSRLLINGQEIINNDGVHYEIFREGYAALEKGDHNIEIQYFDFTRRETLNVSIGKQAGEMYDINRFMVR